MAALTLIAPIPWSDVGYSVALAALGIYMGVRTWQDKPIAPNSTLHREPRMRVPLVAMLPIGVIFLSMSVLGALSQLGRVVHPQGLRDVLFVLDVAGVLATVASALLSITLAFFYRPRRLVPPHIREEL